jgi:hypothetical protein
MTRFFYYSFTIRPILPTYYPYEKLLFYNSFLVFCPSIPASLRRRARTNKDGIGRRQPSSLIYAGAKHRIRAGAPPMHAVDEPHLSWVLGMAYGT